MNEYDNIVTCLMKMGSQFFVELIKNVVFTYYSTLLS